MNGAIEWLYDLTNKEVIAIAMKYNGETGNDGDMKILRDAIFSVLARRGGLKINLDITPELFEGIKERVQKILAVKAPEGVAQKAA